MSTLCDERVTFVPVANDRDGSAAPRRGCDIFHNWTELSFLPAQVKMHQMKEDSSSKTFCVAILRKEIYGSFIAIDA
jgi:hypothetical protein